MHYFDDIITAPQVLQLHPTTWAARQPFLITQEAEERVGKGDLLSLQTWEIESRVSMTG